MVKIPAGWPDPVAVRVFVPVKTEPLTDADMRAIQAIDKGCRLIKGQVFLWKDHQSWEDLWDMDGVIKS